MNKVCDLVQRWRNECDAHKNCIPDDDRSMPTRVLALCGDDAQPSVQLIESKGRKGRYLALSHCWGPCWGPIEKRPLRTTSDNHQVHQDGIPFGDLPKTFQILWNSHKALASDTSGSTLFASYKAIARSGIRKQRRWEVYTRTRL
jgi:hypothetical protein